jgi:hypothetical protein
VDWCYATSSAFSCTPKKTGNGTSIYTPSGFPGGSLAISADSASSFDGSQILWAILTTGSAGPYQDLREPAQSPMRGPSGPTG